MLLHFVVVVIGRSGPQATPSPPAPIFECLPWPTTKVKQEIKRQRLSTSIILNYMLHTLRLKTTHPAQPITLKTNPTTVPTQLEWPDSKRSILTPSAGVFLDIKPHTRTIHSPTTLVLPLYPRSQRFHKHFTDFYKLAQPTSSRRAARFASSSANSLPTSCNKPPPT